jgi:RNA 3'-terminal phosphate cyclase-like protein
MELRGAQSYRHRLLLSTLSGKPVTITRIRSEDEYPGLTDYEVQFVRLLEKVTNGSRVVINQTGTVLAYTPGIIVNGVNELTHDCGAQRSLSYFVEGLLPIVIWGKHPLSIILEGKTHEAADVSVKSRQLETLAAVQLPLLKKIGVLASLKVLTRGNAGRVELKVTPIKQLSVPVSLTDPGKIRRVRGTAYSARISTQMANRTSYAAKGVMMQFLPDVWIHTDVIKGDTPLLGVSLSAESNTGAVHAVDFTKGEPSSVEGLESDVPEDLGQLAALQLLDELFHVSSR